MIVLVVAMFLSGCEGRDIIGRALDPSCYYTDPDGGCYQLTYTPPDDDGGAREVHDLSQYGSGEVCPDYGPSYMCNSYAGGYEIDSQTEYYSDVDFSDLPPIPEPTPIECPSACQLGCAAGSTVCLCSSTCGYGCDTTTGQCLDEGPGAEEACNPYTDVGCVPGWIIPPQDELEVNCVPFPDYSTCMYDYQCPNGEVYSLPISGCTLTDDDGGTAPPSPTGGDYSGCYWVTSEETATSCKVYYNCPGETYYQVQEFPGPCSGAPATPTDPYPASPNPAFCGNGVHDEGETAENCPADFTEPDDGPEPAPEDEPELDPEDYNCLTHGGYYTVDGDQCIQWCLNGMGGARYQGSVGMNYCGGIDEGETRPFPNYTPPEDLDNLCGQRVQ
ncbi:hypothetical protein ACFL96_16630, partial [Thermoproteota archaeon]